MHRIAKALEIAAKHGTEDGAHHKMWVIDQMVRVLTDCVEIERDFKTHSGSIYKASVLGESDLYREWVMAVKASGKEWNTGVAP